jgi:hypothetical protein
VRKDKNFERRFEVNVLYFLFTSGNDSSLASTSSLPQGSLDRKSLPQYPQVTPSLFNQGLCEAHVPLNSPFFKKINRTDMKMKNIATKPMERNKTAMID